MKARVSRAAAADLVEILSGLSIASPSAARGLRERFQHLRSFVGEFPGTGRKTDDPTLHCVNMGRYPYLVFFEVHERQVVIMRIIHGARDPKSMPAKPR